MRVTPPAPVEPQLATLVKEAPRGDAWLHEVKLDGYRIIAHLANGRVVLSSRNGKDWTDRMPSVAAAVRLVKSKSATLDGEVVVLREDGVSDFQQLQNSLGTADAHLTYFAFDLLEENGKRWATRPLEERKTRLAALIAKTDSSSVLRFSEHVEGGGSEFFKHACKLGLEGIISKKRDAPYRAGRSNDWLKIKCGSRQEFVIGGYTEPHESRSGFGALLLGVREGHALRYVGKVGSGFSQASLASLGGKLRALEAAESPFSHVPRMPRVHFVVPSLVCEVSFASTTDNGILRHAAFGGLREDKRAVEVVMEKPRPRITNADKVLWPDVGVTKGELSSYYERVADRMLPHVAGRPLMLVRCPNGIGKCFVQKHSPKTEDILTVNDAAELVALAQAGVIEVHTWGSHLETLERPDLLVFDLDPDESVAWPRVVSAARLVRERLTALDLDSFVKTTGGKGLHVCAPIEQSLSWQAAKEFTKKLAEAIVQEKPKEFVATMSKVKRKGKIFIDYLRNGRGSTFVAPYSPRARPGAKVAMPIDWDDLDAIDPASFTIKTVS